MNNSQARLLPEPLSIGSHSPRYPDFESFSSRLSSYKLHTEYLQQEPEDLAEAGLFYEGSNGKVCCFCCGAKFKGLEAGDDPYIEHARWYPKCTYLKQKKGEQFIKDVQSGNLVVPIINRSRVATKTRRENVTSDTKMISTDSCVKHVAESGSSNKKIEQEFRTSDKLQKEQAMLKNQTKCKICWDQEATTVFIPCGHIASCIFCSPSFHKCPICRTNISNTLEAILV